MSTGDGRSNYNMKDFNKNVIAMPAISEQQKSALSSNNSTTPLPFINVN